LSISGAVGSGRGMTIGIDLLRKDKGGNPEAQRMTVDVSKSNCNKVLSDVHANDIW
jgi:hypothetical protein